MKLSLNIVKNADLTNLEIKDIPRSKSFLFSNINRLISEKKAEIDLLDEGCKWDKMKKLANPYELVYTNHNKKKKNDSIAAYKPISRSYFKLWEMNKEFDIIDINRDKYVISTLAEGPGGFMQALINIRGDNSKDHYYGITLENNNKYIPDWEKLNIFGSQKENLKVIYGDLYNMRDIKYYLSFFTSEKADIVTADGGFDYSVDFNGQEINSTRIIFCEIAVALLSLKVGGHFICKFFDMLTISTVNILYILYSHFQEIYIYKPKTSRPANSEKYLVCKGFIGCLDNTMQILEKMITKMEHLLPILDDSYTINLSNKKIPSDFIHELHNYNKSYSDIQYKYLETTLNYVREKPDKENYTLLLVKQVEKAIEWCNRYNVEINKDSSYYNKYYSFSTFCLTNSS